jgi:hypothetical protein
MRGKRILNHITCIPRRMRFSLYICHNSNFFFQFGPQTLFLDDQVLFKEQLITNSYERVGLEEGGSK